MNKKGKKNELRYRGFPTDSRTISIVKNTNERIVSISNVVVESISNAIILMSRPKRQYRVMIVLVKTKNLLSTIS
jgi:hypothetical protein